MRRAAHNISMGTKRATAAMAGLASCLVLGAAPATADTPGCTGADYSNVTAGVATAMSTYLFSHPDVNDYITCLEKAPRGESIQQLVDYESAHPTVRAELGAIRQPLVDFDTRCGYGTQHNPL